MQRPSLLRTYREQVARYIQFKYGVDAKKADDVSYEICRSRYRPLTAIIEETKNDGQPIIKGVDLASWWDAQRDNIITPSGSVYCQHEVKLGTIIEMLIQFLAKRKVEKKAMLKAKAEGNTTEQLKHYYAQTLIKIFVNALPGNFGSMYSIFCDKGNYNAITSCGRALIGYAYSEIEAVLGGNFMWLTIDDLRIHIVTQLFKGIDDVAITAICQKYNLRRVSKDELYEFYKTSLMRYNHYTIYVGKEERTPFAQYNGHKEGDLAKIQELVWKMTDAQVQYFYYFENLRHIFMENDKVFRSYIEDIFDYDKIPQDDTVNPEDLFKIDGALVTMVNVAFHKYLDPGDPKIQAHDLPKERPELAKRFVNISKYVEQKLHWVDDLFKTFIFTPICRPNVQHQPLLYRNSTVVSDTDSTIFTVKDWVGWYTGSVYSIDEKAYHIAMVMVYWITQAISDALYKYSIAQGARGKYAKVMAMKNEFLYPVMIQADKKKHYMGVITVQEGVILPTPDIDLKGGQFRGSDVPKIATKFAEDLIADLLDELYRKGKVSAHKVVDKVRRFEIQIYNDIQNGDTQWYKTQSIKTKEKYANPMSSPWYYYLAWQEIFAPKYGDILLPIKTPSVPIDKPTESYWTWLQGTDPALCKRWIEFLNKYKRPPTYMAINPVGGKVPKELVPLIKVKDIIHHTVKPCHLALRQLPINCGFEDDNNLFSEIYPVVKGTNPHA